MFDVLIHTSDRFTNNRYNIDKKEYRYQVNVTDGLWIYRKKIVSKMASDCFYILPFYFLGLEMLKQLRQDTNDLNTWLKDLDQFLKDNRVVPIGDPEQLEKMLDLSNVSNIASG